MRSGSSGWEATDYSNGDGYASDGDVYETTGPTGTERVMALHVSGWGPLVKQAEAEMAAAGHDKPNGIMSSSTSAEVAASNAWYEQVAQRAEALQQERLGAAGRQIQTDSPNAKVMDI